MTAPFTESSPLTDAALLAAWNARREHADFEELVRRHLPQVEGTVRRVLGEDCADTVQTVFAILARQAPQLGEVRSLAAWLHQVAVHQSRATIRCRQRERRILSAAMQNAMLHEGRDPLIEALPHLDAALIALSHSDRTLIHLRYSEGLPFAAVAQRTGRSEAALRQQAGRALEKISAALRRRGVSVPSVAIGSGLAAVLHPLGKASAATVAAHALHSAATLAPATLWVALLSTMTTAQCFLTGAGLAALLSAGPVLWREHQIRSTPRAPLAPGLTTMPAPQNTAPVAPLSPQKSTPTAAAKNSAAAATPPIGMEQIAAVMEQEFKEAAVEWARHSAWLKSRRLGYAARLPREREDALRAWLEARSVAGLADHDGGSQPERRLARERELAAWMQQNLTPEELIRWQNTYSQSQTEMVEDAAETALHGISIAVTLTEEQKTRLYEAAAAKATTALRTDDEARSMSFGANYEPPSAPPLENDPALLAGVLDPAQLELWEQTLEQQQLLSEVMPRRIADRMLIIIKERGFGPVIIDAIRDEAPTSATQ